MKYAKCLNVTPGNNHMETIPLYDDRRSFKITIGCVAQMSILW